MAQSNRATLPARWHGGSAGGGRFPAGMAWRVAQAARSRRRPCARAGSQPGQPAFFPDRTVVRVRPAASAEAAACGPGSPAGFAFVTFRPNGAPQSLQPNVPTQPPAAPVLAAHAAIERGAARAFAWHRPRW